MSHNEYDDDAGIYRPTDRANREGGTHATTNSNNTTGGGGNRGNMGNYDRNMGNYDRNMGNYGDGWFMNTIGTNGMQRSRSVWLDAVSRLRADEAASQQRADNAAFGQPADQAAARRIRQMEQSTDSSSHHRPQTGTATNNSSRQMRLSEDERRRIESERLRTVALAARGSSR